MVNISAFDMREFIFTSERFTGSMRFGYNHAGVLELYENNAELDPIQLDYFEHNFPFRLENLHKIKGEKGKIEEVTDLSFEAFWKKYDYKVDKIRAGQYWTKMSKSDKLAALSGIYKYKNRCQIKNVPMIYPVRYLKYRRWEDEA